MASSTSLLCTLFEVVWRLIETNSLIDSLFILTSRASYLCDIVPFLWIFMQDESSLFCVLTDWGWTLCCILVFWFFSLLHKFDKKQKMFLNSNKTKKWNKINECLNNLQLRKQFCQHAKVASFKPWLWSYINILWRLCESHWNFVVAKSSTLYPKNNCLLSHQRNLMSSLQGK